MAVTAADCAGLQRLRSPHGTGGVYQTCLPVVEAQREHPAAALVGSTSVLRL